MYCDPSEISCQLWGIASQLGRPSGWEIAAVIVAGLAAVGTLWIAWLNLRLLKMQRGSEEEAKLQSARLERIVFIEQLLEEAFVRLAPLDVKSAHTDLERSKERFRLIILARRHNFPNGLLMIEWTMQLAGSGPKGTVGRLTRALDDWAEDPSVLPEGLTQPSTTEDQSPRWYEKATFKRWLDVLLGGP